MYNYPYGDNQQINLNWIISEIIALHQRLDPDYTAPTFTQIYPFSETQQLNLDWILTELKALKELAPTPAPTDAIDEVGQALIAGAYDSDTQYQKNDYIVQDGKVYRANAATTGTFDPTKWREVMLGDDLAIITRWADATNTYLNNLAASNVSNDSIVAGDTVKDALATLNGAIASLGSDDIANDSTNVSGLKVTNALDTLNGAINDVDDALTSATEYKIGDSIGIGGFHLTSTNAPEGNSASLFSVSIETVKSIPAGRTLTLSRLPQWIRGNGEDYDYSHSPIPYSVNAITRTSAYTIIIDLNNTSGRTVPKKEVYVTYFLAGTTIDIS